MSNVTSVLANRRLLLVNKPNGQIPVNPEVIRARKLYL